jgi:hypothetical protein
MIQAYENRLGSGAKKKPAKRGRSTSVASLPHSVGRGSGTPGSRAGRPPGRNKKDPVTEYYSASEEEDFSGVEDCDQDLTFGILHECPRGKEVEKIHAVAVVDGYLTFLVQWKRGEGDKRPPISDRNANMVRAISMNKKFPQEVIAFYQSRVQFNLNLEPYEKEAVKAAQALIEAKERRFALNIKRNGDQDCDDDDAEVDPATQAIEKDRRQFDPFDPNESDLSSSESDDELPLVDEDE